MIIKKAKKRSAPRSSLQELKLYLTKENNIGSRVGEITLSNLESRNVDDAVLEMVLTQEMNNTSKSDKLYHIIMSFPEGERPSDEELIEMEDRIASDLGYQDHQRFSVQHTDTDFFHVHIAINKIHPETHNTHDPYYDFSIMAKTAIEIEEEYGLIKTNHDVGLKNNKSVEIERLSNVESFLSYAKGKVSDLNLNEITSWQILHDKLAENGMEIKPRGAGLVVQDIESGIKIKASDVAREFSKKKLEDRLGDYAESKSAVDKTEKGSGYQLNSVIGSNPINGLYKEYQEKRRAEYQSYQTQKNKAYKELKKRRENIKNQWKMKRKLFGSKWANKINHRIYQAQLKALSPRASPSIKRFQWVDFLRQKAMAGNKDAIEYLRKRQKQELVYGVKGVDGGRNLFVQPDDVTSGGRLLYTNGKGHVIRDNGERLFTSDYLNEVALEKLLNVALEKYGEKLDVKGSQAFKNQVVKTAVNKGIKVEFSDQEMNVQFENLKKEKLINDRKNQHQRFVGRTHSRARISSRRSRGGTRNRIGIGRLGEFGGRGSIYWNEGLVENAIPESRRGIGERSIHSVANYNVGLRSLPSLDMVHDRRVESEMLLQHDAPNNMGSKGQESRRDTGLRWERDSRGREGGGRDEKNDGLNRRDIALLSYLSKINEREKGVVLTNQQEGKAQDVEYHSKGEVSGYHIIAFHMKGDNESLYVTTVSEYAYKRAEKNKKGDVLTLTKDGKIQQKQKKRKSRRV